MSALPPKPLRLVWIFLWLLVECTSSHKYQIGDRLVLTPDSQWSSHMFIFVGGDHNTGTSVTERLLSSQKLAAQLKVEQTLNVTHHEHCHKLRAHRPSESNASKNRRLRSLATAMPTHHSLPMMPNVVQRSHVVGNQFHHHPAPAKTPDPPGTTYSCSAPENEGIFVTNVFLDLYKYKQTECHAKPASSWGMCARSQQLTEWDLSLEGQALTNMLHLPAGASASGVTAEMEALVKQLRTRSRSSPGPSSVAPSHQTLAEVLSNASSSFTLNQTLVEELRKELFTDWSWFWDTSKLYLVEKDISNSVKSRFLQTLFTDSQSAFVYVMRHPLAR